MGAGGAGLLLAPVGFAAWAFSKRESWLRGVQLPDGAKLNQDEISMYLHFGVEEEKPESK